MLLEPIETEKLFPISLYFGSKGLVILILIIILVIIIIINVLLMIIIIMIMLMVMIMIMIMYCLKNEQECIIRFTKIEASPRAFKRDNTRLEIF